LGFVSLGFDRVEEEKARGLSPFLGWSLFHGAEAPCFHPKAKASAKAKCGGLSISAAKAPPSVEMTVLFDRYGKRTSKANSRSFPFGSAQGQNDKQKQANGKDGRLMFYIPTHRGKAAMDGAPDHLWGKLKDRQRQRPKQQQQQRQRQKQILRFAQNDNV
jgi:hypothetical protein